MRAGGWGMLVAAALIAGRAGAATFVVTTTADGADGVCDAQCTLREAIGAANLSPGTDVIAVPSGAYTLTRAGAGEDANASGDLDVTDDAIIAAAGARATTIDAAGLDRALQVINATVEIEAVTIRGGAAGAEPGGGVGAFGGGLTLRRVAIEDNHGANGGGVYAGASHLTVIDSTISGNVGVQGGGIYYQGFTRQLVVRNSTISGNTAAAAGGLFVDLECGFLDPCAVESSTIAGNIGTAGAGGVQCIAPLGSLQLAGSIVAENGGGNCAASSVVSLGHNLSDDPSCPFGAGGDQSGVAAGLLPRRANGGPTDTHGLAAGSAALDQGGVCPPADQRGQPRAGSCDVGAFEAATGPCGDGVTHLGELCDDGNGDADDCCDACVVAPDGATCADDGDLCTADRCDGARARCAHLAVPALDCRAAGRSLLSMRAGDGVQWKWLRGAATAAPDLGNPTAGTTYAVCVYTDGSSAVATRLDLAGVAAWSAAGGGFRYRDGDAGRTARLRAGADGRARIQVRADDMPVPGLPLGAAAVPVIVQLRNDQPGGCWESRFDADDVVRDDAGEFRAKTK